MSEATRKTWDNDKAIAFFNETEGMPYGYANFLYGWIDTAEDNWPPLLPVNFVPTMFSVVEKISPSTTAEFYDLAINKHLGTEGLNI